LRDLGAASGVQPIATEVPMLWRQRMSLVVLAVLVGALSACGHSEEEWQAKLKENQELQNQLNAEKAAHQIGRAHV